MPTEHLLQALADFRAQDVQVRPYVDPMLYVKAQPVPAPVCDVQLEVAETRFAQKEAG